MSGYCEDCGNTQCLCAEIAADEAKTGSELAAPAGSEARIKELETEVKRLKQYEARLNWLHTGGGQTDCDPEGYEWGVARVKFDAHGQVTSVLWTDSDHKDVEAEMERT